RTTEIQVGNGTSNFLTVVGQDTAQNVDAPARPTYTTALDTIALSGPVLEDLAAIAAAGEAESGGFAGVGDNRGALAMAELQDRQDIFGAGGSFDGFFNTTISLLGTLSQGNERQLLNQEALVEQIDGQRQAVFGVNLDEEAVDLIKFQKAFEASARVVATLQTTYDAILSLAG
ncbi:MAG TPA: flagellar basal body rod C-terminal domain-containing protein, partial [bacterium]|nr:flagellar basal body rod C-terminal domain-containing protein [bacterium]